MGRAKGVDAFSLCSIYLFSGLATFPAHLDFWIWLHFLFCLFDGALMFLQALACLFFRNQQFPGSVLGMAPGGHWSPWCLVQFGCLER